MPAPDPQQEIERAAQEHRERVHAESAKAQPAVLSREQLKRILEKDLLVMSLSTGAIPKLMVGVANLVCVGATIALVLILGMPRPSFLLILGAVAGCMALCTAVTIWLDGPIAASRVRWIGRIGHGFDGPRYLELMKQKRRDGVLVVRLCFERPSGASRTVADAVRGWMPELAGSAWESDTVLRIESGTLAGRLYRPGGKSTRGRHYFSNARMHACFTRVMHRIVPKLDAANPITQLSVEIVGDVLPFDASP